MHRSKSCIATLGAGAWLAGGLTMGVCLLALRTASGGASKPIPWAAIRAGGVGGTAAGFAQSPLGVYLVACLIGLALVGAVMALMLGAAEREPELTWPLFLFGSAFQVFISTVLLLDGPSQPLALPWWKAMTGVLAGAGITQGLLVSGFPAARRALSLPAVEALMEGAQAGAMGGVAGLVWFAVSGRLNGGGLRAPALLGATLFGSWHGLGAGGTAPALLVAGFIAALLFGIGAGLGLMLAEWQPAFLLALLAFCAVSQFQVVGLVSALSVSSVPRFAVVQVVGADLVALGTIALFLWSRHQRLVARLASRMAWFRSGAELNAIEVMCPETRQPALVTGAMRAQEPAFGPAHAPGGLRACSQWDLFPFCARSCMKGLVAARPQSA